MLDLFLLDKSCRSACVSTYDLQGGNRDYFTILPKQELEVARIEGPAVIRHMWMTVWSIDVLYLRKLILKIYWDDNPFPSVCCPLGDFFGLGHSIALPYQSLLMNATGGDWNFSALNCYIPMPFRRNARITVFNGCAIKVEKFFHIIDYTKENIPSSMGYLNVQWQRERSTGNHQGKNVPFDQQWDLMHKSGEGNYVALKTSGQGRYLGCNISGHFLDRGEMEGDYMIFIDGESWPPSFHGTGTEEYFGCAYGLQNINHLFHGATLHHSFEKDLRFASYRWHVPDPVFFSKSIEVSFEHGHANVMDMDIASAAYWYQTKPVNTGFEYNEQLLLPPKSEYLENLQKKVNANEVLMKLDEPGQNMRHVRSK